MAVARIPHPRGADRDGGRSAALADGAHERAWAAVRTLDYWEALYEPPWDIGWDRVQGIGWRPCQPRPRISAEEWRRYAPPVSAPPATPGNPARQAVAERRRLWAQVRAQRQARGWTQRQLAEYCGLSVAALSYQERRGTDAWLAGRCLRVLMDPAELPPPKPSPMPSCLPAPVAPAVAAWPPPDYTCNGCRRPSWLHGPRPAPGRYTVHCNDCDAYTLIEVS